MKRNMVLEEMRQLDKEHTLQELSGYFSCQLQNNKLLITLWHKSIASLLCSKILSVSNLERAWCEWTTSTFYDILDDLSGWRLECLVLEDPLLRQFLCSHFATELGWLKNGHRTVSTTCSLFCTSVLLVSLVLQKQVFEQQESCMILYDLVLEVTVSLLMHAIL